MPLFRHLTALIVLLSVFTAVCEGCAPTAIVDSCCDEPCQECACFDAQPIDQPAAAFVSAPEMRPDAAASALESGARSRNVRYTVVSRTGGRPAPSEPPSRALLNVYRI